MKFKKKTINYICISFDFLLNLTKVVLKIGIRLNTVILPTKGGRRGGFRPISAKNLANSCKKNHGKILIVAKVIRRLVTIRHFEKKIPN